LPVRPPEDTGAEADETAGAVFWTSFMAEMTGWAAFELNSSNSIDNHSLGDHYAVKKARKVEETLVYSIDLSLPGNELSNSLFDKQL
jgi:hypothetical protein